MILKNKKITTELAIFLIYPIIASLISFSLKTSAFDSVMIFYGLPSLYLSFKMIDKIKIAAIWAFIGILPMIIIDYIAHLTGTWIIPDSILPFRLFGFVTIEVIVWVMFAFILQ